MHARTLGTAVLTFILALTIGFAALVGTVSAEDLTFPNVAGLDIGDLVTTDSTDAVYYFGADNKRYTFPNNGTYMTWYDDFDDVVTITDEQLTEISFGGIVTYKPYEQLVKIQSVPTVYHVAQEGVLMALDSEAAAAEQYGDDWASMIDDIPDGFWGLYTISSEVIEEGDDLLAEFDGTDYTIGDDMNLKGVTGVFMYSDPVRFTATDESVDCEEEYCAYNEATVNADGRLKFVNYSGETLTVSEDSGLWTTGEMADGDIVVLTIGDEAGTYNFTAEEDDTMTGVLIVE